MNVLIVMKHGSIMNKIVEYKQGMTEVWSDGEKITVNNKSGIKWVKTNIEQIFGIGEWEKIRLVAYTEIHHSKSKSNNIRAYECISGYIPQRVIDDLTAVPIEDELSEVDTKKAILEALKDDS